MEKGEGEEVKDMSMENAENAGIVEKAEDKTMKWMDGVAEEGVKWTGAKVTSGRQGLKRSRSSLSSRGGECEAKRADGTIAQEAGDGVALAPSSLGSLHKRRASASPEKFNQYRFEPLTLQKGRNEDGDGPPAKKKARVESNKVEIEYDETGTPRIASFAAVEQEHSEQPLDHVPDQPTPTSETPSNAPSTTSTPLTLSAPTIPQEGFHTSHLLNITHPTTPRKPFPLLHAICRDNDLLLTFVSYLPIPALISLYAISKPFHYLFNRHHTAFILACMRTWAPNADKVYPWRCYKSLCVKDPVKRQKRRLQGMEGVFEEKGRKWEDLRDVPSLRWLQMVVWREGVCKDMLIQLATKGLRCPPGTLDAVKRMWFLLDLPLNTHRIALIHDTEYITKIHLHALTFFLLKVDMAFTDPDPPAYPHNHPNSFQHPPQWGGGQPSGVHLRKILLAERQLTPLWRVLRGWNPDPREPAVPMTRLDVLRLWVRHTYKHPDDTPEEVRQQPIMSVPWYEVGAAGLERTGVAFHDLTSPSGTKTQIAVTHPSIVSREEASSQTQHPYYYPHAKRLLILPHTKPRERLLRPDELVIRESIRRKLSMHKKWAKMMLWGFCDVLGFPVPVRSEEEILRVGREKVEGRWRGEEEMSGVVGFEEARWRLWRAGLGPPEMAE